MKIYDCFTFFNELELLEIRLSELDDHVDYFVIVEAKKTHSGEEKELYFANNKKRFSKWSKKIIHIVVDFPNLNLLDNMLIKMEKTKLYNIARWFTVNLGLGRWKLENYQRTSINQGLKKAKEEDIIMVSDLDEIPRPSKLKDAIKYSQQGNIVKFRQDLFYYYLNGKSDEKWTGTKMCSYEFLIKRLKNNPQYIRVLPLHQRIIQKLFPKTRRIKFVDNSGWHFSYLGGTEKIKIKRKALAHTEISSEELVNDEQILKDIQEGILNTKDKRIKINYIEIDNSFPTTIYKNKQKYSNLIKNEN